MFQKILVPVDFAPPSRHGLQMARALLAEGGTLRIVYVVDEASLTPVQGMLDLSGVEDKAEEQVEELARSLRDEGLQVEAEVISGPVVEQILAQGQAFGAEALCIGSHGRTGLSRLLMGSVAERLLRESTVPVAVVKHEHEGGLAKLAFTTDFSEASAKAFSVFCDLSKGRRGDIVHALDEDAWMLQASMIATSVPIDLGPVEQHAEQGLARLRDEAKALGCEAEAHLLRGSPWEKIESFTKDGAHDLLVLGTHGYRQYERFVLGSVAQKILRIASCPILIVPTIGS